MTKKILKVSGKTNPKKLAGAIFLTLKENGGEVTVQAVGAGAVNQAVKGIAIARGMSATLGMDLKLIPGFQNIKIHDRDVTAIQLTVHAA
jgi:stage V sporulation protein S